MKYILGTVLGSTASFASVTIGNATGMTVQAATQKVAYKFYADLTMTVNACDFTLLITGTTTGITMTAHIETDGGNVPSGTVVGAATASFACPSATGQVGLQNFVTPPVLTAGVPYWLVIQDGGGTAPTVSNFYQLRVSSFNNGAWAGGVERNFNGTNWTTVAVVNSDGSFILQDSLGNFHGGIASAATTSSARTAIFGTNYQGTVMKFNTSMQIYGVRCIIRLSGVAPGALECVMTQDGGTALAVSQSVASGSFVTVSVVMFVFNGGVPITIPANTNVYFLLHQVGGAGASGTSYTFNVSKIDSTYISAVVNSDYRQVAGTLASNNADPSGLTRFTDEIPQLNPIIVNPSTDFITPATENSSVFL